MKCSKRVTLENLARISWTKATNYLDKLWEQKKITEDNYIRLNMKLNQIGNDRY